MISKISNILYWSVKLLYLCNILLRSFINPTCIQQYSNSEKSVIKFKVMMYFILSRVTDFRGNTSQRVRKKVFKYDYTYWNKTLTNDLICENICMSQSHRFSSTIVAVLQWDKQFPWFHAASWQDQTLSFVFIVLLERQNNEVKSICRYTHSTKSLTYT